MSWRKKFSYSFYVLALATLIYGFVTGTDRMCMPVLFPEISRDLGLSMVQLGTVWGIDPFAGIFVALIAGLIVDRFGIKLCLITLCLVAGIFGALRGLSTNFITMAGSMFLFGLFGAMLPTVTQKTLAIWFPGKRFALATSILGIGWTICAVVGTMMSATVFSPALHGWRNVLLIYGIPPIIFSLVGLVTIREPKEGKVLINQPDTSFRHLFLHVVRIKEVWVIGLIVLGFMGSAMGLIGYLAVYLKNIGWTNAAASGAVTIFSAAGGISSVPLALLSNKIGSRTKVLVPADIIVAVSFALLPFADGTLVWVLMIVNGIARGCLMPLLSTIAIEKKAVGAKYAGTTIGLIMTFNMIGCALLPPIGNSLAGINPGFPIIFWAAISALTLIGFFFIKEKREAVTVTTP